MNKPNALVVGVLDAMAANPIQNYISPGLISSVITNGKVRMFTNTRPQEQTITPHSHRFNFAAYVVKGTVKNTLYQAERRPMYGGNAQAEGPSYQYSRSWLHYEGECGKYQKQQGPVSRYYILPTTYEAGEWYYMDSKEIHSIEFSPDAQVLLFEGPNTSDTTVILEPFVDGKKVDTFKVEDWMFKKENAS